MRRRFGFRSRFGSATPWTAPMVKTVPMVAGIRWVGRQTGLVKTLSGFTKSKHTVPDAVNAATTAFLGRLCADELSGEAEDYFSRARTTFAYKRKDIGLSVTPPGAVLQAIDFQLEWTYALQEANPAEYEVVRTLTGVVSADWLRSEGCEALFAGVFAELSFALVKGAPVEKVIDAVEGLEDSALRVDYPSDCRWCRLSVPGVDAEVRFDGRELAMIFPRAGSPAELWDAFLQVRSAFRLSDEAVLAGLVGRPDQD